MTVNSFCRPGRWLAGITLLAASYTSATAQTTAQPPIAGLRDLPDISAPQLSATPAITSSMIVAEPEATYVPAPQRDRLGRMPNLMSDFFARTGQANISTMGGPTTFVGTFTGLNSSAQNIAAGGFGQLVLDATTFTGPNGFTGMTAPSGAFGVPPNPNAIFTVLTYPQINTNLNTQFPPPYQPTPGGNTSPVGLFTTPLLENAGLTQQIQAMFPGATYIANSGQATLSSYQNPSSIPAFIAQGDTFTDVYLYLLTNPNGGTMTTVVLAPNPVGGGLVGRNRYFENGSPVPRDRVYFYYTGVSDFRTPGRDFQINRYTFGGEKTFFDGLASVEARIPFAGTLNPTQTAGASLATDYITFGNVGVLGKVAVYRSENFILTTGLGLSLPTANDTRVRDAAGNTLLRVNNEAILLQPIIGAAWAPTDRAFIQGGAQFDFDPMGNPVQLMQSDGTLAKIGQWQDQKYAFVHGGLGYWVYDNPEASYLTGLAVTGELTYSTTMGATREVAQSGNVIVAPTTSRLETLNATVGVNALIAEQATAAFGVVLPVGGQRLYDYALQAQLNWNFGRPRFLPTVPSNQ